MVVLVFMGHAKIETDFVQEVGLGKFHAFGFEVVADIKDQAVCPFAEAGVVVEHAVGVAAVGVEGEAFDQSGLIALRRVQGHLHARGGAAVHGVQDVCAQSHGVLACLEWGSKKGGLGQAFKSLSTGRPKCIQFWFWWL